VVRPQLVDELLVVDQGNARRDEDPRLILAAEQLAEPVAGALGGAGRAPGLAMPRISRSVTATFSIWSALRSSRNFDIGISIVRGDSSQLCRNDRTMIATSK